MTVQELIDHLKNIEDKEAKVFVHDEDGHMRECHATDEYLDGVVELF